MDHDPDLVELPRSISQYQQMIDIELESSSSYWTPTDGDAPIIQRITQQASLFGEGFQNIYKKATLPEKRRINKLESCTDFDLHAAKESIDIFPAVEQFIEMILCRARTIIATDTRHLFFYKFTSFNAAAGVTNAAEVNETNSCGDNDDTTIQTTKRGEGGTAADTQQAYAMPRRRDLYSSISYVSTSSKNQQQQGTSINDTWTTIGNFSYARIKRNIRDYASRWNLTPPTKGVLLEQHTKQVIPDLGERYTMEIHFSKPTPECPNPLPVAKVYFIVTVPYHMQKHYPVMVSYFFELHKTLYYVVGERATRNTSFQRFFIDAILHTKLMFYASICECHNGTMAKPKSVKKRKGHKCANNKSKSKKV